LTIHLKKFVHSSLHPFHVFSKKTKQYTLKLAKFSGEKLLPMDKTLEAIKKTSNENVEAESFQKVLHGMGNTKGELSILQTAVKDLTEWMAIQIEETATARYAR